MKLKIEKINVKMKKKCYHNAKNMKIIKKYCKYSSRGREVGWGRGRPKTGYLNLNRTRTHPKPVQCCG